MKKQFYTQNNIGTAKYTISYHDGESTYKDGSPFFGILLFSSKKKFESKIKELKNQGYKATN